MTLTEALRDIQREVSRPVELEQLIRYLNESSSVLAPQVEHCFARKRIELTFTSGRAPLPPDFYKARALIVEGRQLPYSPPYLFFQDTTDEVRWTILDNFIRLSSDSLIKGELVYLVRPEPFSLSMTDNWWLQDTLRWQTLKYLTLTRYLLDKDRWSLWTALFKNALRELQASCSSKKSAYVEGERL